MSVIPYKNIIGNNFLNQHCKPFYWLQKVLDQVKQHYNPNYYKSI